MNAILDRLLRQGRDGPQEVRIDIAWLCCLGLLLFATGIGLRDPWPADEPRFALVARDMVAHQQWLIPQVGADNYADKPPLFFWMMACVLTLTGSLRSAFLVPSLLAGLGCVLLVDQRVRERCFAAADARPVDAANGMQWSLVSAAAEPACIDRGKLSAALFYEPAKLDRDTRIAAVP